MGRPRTVLLGSRHPNKAHRDRCIQLWQRLVVLIGCRCADFQDPSRCSLDKGLAHLT